MVTPNPEVLERPVHCKFTVNYKRKILDEANVHTEHGEFEELLRREGLYSSHLITWWKQGAQGMLEGLAPKKRGLREKRIGSLFKENEKLRRETERLRARLKQAETVIDVQKKSWMSWRFPRGPGPITQNESCREIEVGHGCHPGVSNAGHFTSVVLSHAGT